MAKYIFTTGGVVSGLGKGIIAASLGRLLINRGLRITILKLDPYMNVYPGILDPLEHGEIFVTDDGAETDLDLGHYERFLGINFNQGSSRSSGQIYTTVRERELNGEYKGKSVQIVPHVTNEIINSMKEVGKGHEIVIVEIGGTVGDIEQMPHIEAIRQFRKQLGDKNSISIHVTLVPYLECSNEIKTKPTQASVKELSQMGIQPDIVVCRTNKNVKLDVATRKKIAMFCNLDNERMVMHCPDANSIYEVPVVIKDQKLDEIILEKFGLVAHEDYLAEWNKMLAKMMTPHPEKTVAIVGKHTAMPDAYLSVTEALKHAGFNNEISIKTKLVDVRKDMEKELNNVDAVVMPVGFGPENNEGMIHAIKYARENKIPFVGICSGFQMAAIEFARNVLGLENANSTKFDENTPYPVLIKKDTQRLGKYDCTTLDGKTTQERHRHWNEFNNDFRKQFEDSGFKTIGINKKLDTVEMMKLDNHPYFVTTMFHPEFLSRPYAPHSIFVGLVNAIKENK